MVRQTHKSTQRTDLHAQSTSLPHFCAYASWSRKSLANIQAGSNMSRLRRFDYKVYTTRTTTSALRVRPIRGNAEITSNVAQSCRPSFVREHEMRNAAQGALSGLNRFGENQTVVIDSGRCESLPHWRTCHLRQFWLAHVTARASPKPPSRRSLIAERGQKMCAFVSF